MTVPAPSNLSYGKVVWQTVSDIVDGSDPDVTPDFIAPTGTVSFTPSMVAGRDITATPNPVTVVRDTITGVLDEDGYLCTPDPADPSVPGARGVWLIATDDPDLNPADWVYNVTYAVKGANNRTIPLKSHQIYVPTYEAPGDEVDLTVVGPVDNAQAIGIPAAEAAAAAAVVAAAEAAASAAAAEASMIDSAAFVGDELATAGTPAQIADAANQAARARKYEATFNILDYGAKVDGRELTDVSMTSGSAVLDSAGYTFTSGDIGKKVGVAGAGPTTSDLNTNANDAVLIATITSVTSGNATLSVAASNTVTGAVAVFGTPDDTAIAAAQTAAFAAGGGIVFFPPGRTVVTQSLYCQNFVTWAGVHRDVSWVDVIFDAGTETATNKLSWLHCSGRSAANPLTGVSFRDFGVNARFQVRSGGFVPGIKALNIFHVNRCAITHMNVWNTGGTAIPFDHQYESVLIGWNIIKNPGRLYPAYDGSAVKYGRGGGSGIGIGTINDGTVEPGLIIGNTILGVGSSSGTPPKGNNGIFLEAQGISTDPALPAIGFRIVDNYVSGMWAGIRDAGAIGTVISNNTIVKCVKGIPLDFTAVRGSYPGQDALVIGNVIADSFVDTDALREGCGISITGDKDHGSSVRARIVENVILRSGGRAIYVEVGYTPMERIVIARNKIRGAVRSGIYFALSTVTTTYLNRPVIVDNDIAEHGSGAVSNDTHGINIYVEAKHATIKNNRVVGADGFRLGATGNLSEGGEVSGNDFPTVAVASGTIATTVRIFGNLGWLTADAQSMIFASAVEFISVSGSPVLGHTTRHPRWAMPIGTTSIVAVNVEIPSDWNTATLNAVYTSASGSTLVVNLRADVQFFDIGDAILAASPTSGTAVLSTVDNTVRTAALATLTPAGKRFASINIGRIIVAGDTLNVDALLLGVQLVRAS